jgi:hypothetical protein
VTIFRIQLTHFNGQSMHICALDKGKADSFKTQFETEISENGLDASVAVIMIQTTTDSCEYQNAKKNSKPEPPACNCTTSFDLSARCCPPSSAICKSAICKYGSDDLGWFKFRDHEDNWEHCPVRVDTAKAHFVNSRCLHDSMHFGYNCSDQLRDDGHNEAKWREASELIGLTEAETEAVIAMRDRDRFHTPVSDYSEEVGCYCPTCYYEGTCHVSATRAKELQELGELEENDDHPNCCCNNSDGGQRWE